MTDVSFTINPITLANMLTNAVEISKESASVEAPDVVLLAYQPSADGTVGQVLAYGCGRYAAGRTLATLDGLPSAEAASLSITRDHAAELSTALRKTSRAADTRVGVEFHSSAVEGVHPETGGPTWGNLVVIYQERHLAVLHDSDPHGKFDAIWQRVDDLIVDVPSEAPAEVAFRVDVLSRLGKAKGVGDIADIRQTPMPGVIAVRLGANFVALLGEINRTGYVNGGRWKDGPGKKEHLWS